MRNCRLSGWVAPFTALRGSVTGEGPCIPTRRKAARGRCAGVAVRERGGVAPALWADVDIVSERSERDSICIEQGT